MLAIATPNPDSVAETFVRQHIRFMAPGRTSVLYFHGKGESIADLPSMKIGGSDSQSGKNLMLRGWNFLARGYTGSIAGRESKLLSEFLSEQNIHTIYAEFGPTGCALRHFCKVNGIKLFVNFHGHDATVMARRWQTRRSYRWLAKDADGFICGSRFFAGVLESLGLPKSKIHVVPCGIETIQFNDKAEKDSNLVVAVGRFVEKKAPDLTIETFAKVIKKMPTARLEMIGDGPLMQQCKTLVKQLGIEESVVFHGARSHAFVKERLARASVFVQHSVTAKNGDMESQGISLLEAMASAVPVIATRHNGFVETVLENETGFLVDEFDISGMAEKVLELLSDQEQRTDFGENGKRRVTEKYEAEIVTCKLREILSI